MTEKIDKDRLDVAILGREVAGGFLYIHSVFTSALFMKSLMHLLISFFRLKSNRC
jgi:hypothetical protein